MDQGVILKKKDGVLIGEDKEDWIFAMLLPREIIKSFLFFCF